MPAIKRTLLFFIITMLILTPVLTQAAPFDESAEKGANIFGLDPIEEELPEEEPPAEELAAEKPPEEELPAEEPPAKNEIPLLSIETDAFDFATEKAKGLDKYGLSLFPLSGFFLGQAEEILYKYPGRDQYVSQLLWDILPVIYIGFSFDYGLKDPFQNNGLTAAVSMKFGLPLGSGAMEDRDWVSRDHDGLTDFSWHEAYSINTLVLDVYAGYSWHILNNFSLSAYGEFSFMYFSWSAENGYSQYNSDSSGNPINGGSWNSSIPKSNMYGPIILYNQNWFLISPGVQAKYKINSLFTLDAFLNYSPLIFGFSRDDHLIGDKKTSWDFPRFGHYLNGRLKLTYSLLSKIDLSCSLSYKFITGSRGDSIYQPANYADGQVFQNIYNSGAGLGVFDFFLAVRINIF